MEEEDRVSFRPHPPWATRALTSEGTVYSSKEVRDKVDALLDYLLGEIEDCEETPMFIFTEIAIRTDRDG